MFVVGYFFCFILIGSVLSVNLFVAVVSMNFEIAHKKNNENSPT